MVPKPSGFCMMAKGPIAIIRALPWRRMASRGRSPLVVFALLGAALVLVRATAGFSFELQILALAFAAASGLPHGALDMRRAAQTLPVVLGRQWAILFITTYLLTTVAVFAAWLAAPIFTLTLFLALGWLHFGREDARAHGRTDLPSALLHGGAPVAGAILLNAQAVQEAFALLTGGNVDTLMGLLLLAGSVWAGGMIYAAVRGKLAMSQVVEIVTVLVAIALLPLLLAFALYFGIVHSPRALRVELEDAGEPHWRMLAKTAPFSLAAVGLSVLAVDRLSLATEPGSLVISIVFIGLAALTVPHMAFGAVFRCLSMSGPIRRTGPGYHTFHFEPADRSRD